MDGAFHMFGDTVSIVMSVLQPAMSLKTAQRISLPLCQRSCHAHPEVDAGSRAHCSTGTRGVARRNGAANPGRPTRAPSSRPGRASAACVITKNTLSSQFQG